MSEYGLKIQTLVSYIQIESMKDSEKQECIVSSWFFIMIVPYNFSP